MVEWNEIPLGELVSLQRGHDLLEDVEERIRAAVPSSTVFTHLEPLEDPLSWRDTKLGRDD